MIVTKEKCYICDSYSIFRIDDHARLYREAKCVNCGSSLRNSDTASIITNKLLCKDTSLDKSIDDLRTFKILEAQSSGPIHNLLKHLPSYVCFEYYDGILPGAYMEGILCNDLESLSFDDNSFDVIVTQDVLEHIERPDKAFSEINRVLKPGGYHIFTVPLHESRKSKRRDTLPNVFHGDPIRPDGALVYTDWGEDTSSVSDSYGMQTERFDLHRFYEPSEITDVDASYDEYLSTDALDYYRYNSIVFASRKLRNLPINHRNDVSLKLLDYGPQDIIEGVPFNVQPSGEAAIWASTENASKNTVLVIDNVALETWVDSTGQLVTAKVPFWLYRTAAEYSIFLYDRVDKRKSNKLVLSIRGGRQIEHYDPMNEIRKLEQENLNLHKQLELYRQMKHL